MFHHERDADRPDRPGDGAFQHQSQAYGQGKTGSVQPHAGETLPLAAVRVPGPEIIPDFPIPCPQND